MTGRILSIVVSMILFALCSLGQAGVGAAATLVVTTSADTNDGVCDTDCSLREAIAAAGSGDTITFADDLSGQTITLDSTLTIAKDLTISGPGAANLTISGGGSVRIFYQSAGIFTLEGVTLADGSADANGGGAILANNGVTTTVTGCVFTNNRSTSVGGAIAGWALSCIISDSTFTGNSASSGGAIYNSGYMTVTNATLSGNSTTFDGGAIYNGGGMTVTNSTLSANSATQDGGAVFTAGRAI